MEEATLGGYVLRLLPLKIAASQSVVHSKRHGLTAVSNWQAGRIRKHALEVDEFGNGARPSRISNGRHWLRGKGD